MMQTFVSWLPMLLMLAVWLLFMRQIQARHAKTTEWVKENSKAIEANSAAVRESLEKLTAILSRLEERDRT